MKLTNRICILILSFFLISCQKNVGFYSIQNQNLNPVIGGSNAAANEFPFLVNIWLNDPQDSYNAHLCGGSLISSRWVLTAAHCMTEDASETSLRTVNPKKLLLFLGSNSITGTGGRKVTARSVIVHPKFSWPHHDVALIELNESVNDFEPVKLYPQDQGSILKPNSAIVMGWGLTDLAGKIDGEILQKTTLTLIDRKTCTDDEFPKKRGWVIGTDNLCAQTNMNRTASCPGDSGGPLVQIINGKYNQIGIVSWGSACGGSRSLHSNVDGYASVYDAYQWIQSTAR